MNKQLEQRRNQLKPFLLAAQRQISSLLEDDVKAKKFMAASLTVASNPALTRCSPDSIVQALVGVAMSDLNIDPNIGHCYLVPYGENVQLQTSYKGYIQLLFRAGWMIKALPVYNCDDFEMEFDGWDNKVKFMPDIDSRDEGDSVWVFENLRGVYVVARQTDTKDEYSTFVSKRIIEKLRSVSPNQKGGQPTGVWEKWYMEMAIAKAVKRLAKILPIGDKRVQINIATDDKNDIGKQVDYIKMAENDDDIIIEMETEDTGRSVQAASADTTPVVELADVLKRVYASSSQKDLDAIVNDIETLNGSDHKTARSAWMNRKRLISAVNEKPDKKPRAEPKDEQKQVDQGDDWVQRIKKCDNSDSLNKLLSTMPETAQIQYSDTINEQFDCFRMTGGKVE